MEYSRYSRLFLLLNGFIHAIINSQYVIPLCVPFFHLLVEVYLKIGICLLPDSGKCVPFFHLLVEVYLALAAQNDDGLDTKMWL